MRFLCVAIRMNKIQLLLSNAGENVESKYSTLLLDGTLTWYDHIGKPVSVSRGEAGDSIHALIIIRQSYPVIVPQMR